MHQDTIPLSIATRYWLKAGDRYTFKSVKPDDTKSKTHSSHSFRLLRLRPSPSISCKNISTVSQRLYFLSFLSTIALGPQVPEERKEKRSEGSGYAVRKRKRGERPTEMRGKRSLVNARENWLLNLAAGMSAPSP